MIKPLLSPLSVGPYMLKTSDNPDGTEQSKFDPMAQAIKEDRAKFFTGFFKDFFGVPLLSNRATTRLQLAP